MELFNFNFLKNLPYVIFLYITCCVYIIESSEWPITFKNSTTTLHFCEEDTDKDPLYLMCYFITEPVNSRRFNVSVEITFHSPPSGNSILGRMVNLFMAVHSATYPYFLHINFGNENIISLPNDRAVCLAINVFIDNCSIRLQQPIRNYQEIVLTPSDISIEMTQSFNFTPPEIESLQVWDSFRTFSVSRVRGGAIPTNLPEGTSNGEYIPIKRNNRATVVYQQL